MSSSVSACYEALDRVQRIESLDQPCRTAVIVDSAFGIIGNGGFQYFFESNFPGDPSYDTFTQAFRSVGLDEIAQRFSELVAMFPFDHPHQCPLKRQKFLDSDPSEFDAAKSALEDLIFSFADVDEVLNTYLRTQASKSM